MLSTTSSAPHPRRSLTCVPDLHQGSASFFLMGSLSPVRDASSTTRPNDSTTRPSATTWSVQRAVAVEWQ